MISEGKLHISREPLGLDGPIIGYLTCHMIDGVLWLFDAEGRRLNTVQSIQVNQSFNDVTTATVVLAIGMANSDFVSSAG